MESFREKTIKYFLFSLIFLFLILRVYNIRQTSPDVDEALFVQLSMAHPKYLLDQVVRVTPDPPVSFYAANIFKKLNLNVLYSMRYFSLFAFIAAFLVVIFSVKKYLTNGTYRLLLLLIAINPLLFFYSRFAKPYIFEFFIVSLIVVVVLRIINEYRDYHLILFGLLNALLFYWSYHTVYFILLAFTGLAFVLYERNNLKRYLFRVSAASATTLLVLLPWLFTFLYQFHQIKRCWAPNVSNIFKFSLLGTVQDILFFVCNGNWFFWPKTILFLLAAISTPMILFSIYKILKERPDRFCTFLLITGTGPFILSLILSLKGDGYIYYPRMFISSMIPFLILLSCGTERIIHTKAGKALTLTVFVLMILSSSAIVANRHPVKSKDMNPVTDILREKKDANTAIVIHPPILAYLIKTYGLDDFYSVCADVSNTQGSTCSSFVNPDGTCLEFISRLSNKYERILFLNNKPLSELMVDREKMIYRFFESFYNKNEYLYQDSQYEIIRYEK